ncbi:MAG: hypothetical protein R2746_15255 [Acidimicrobiales bacterium]|nr:hypothetical protein [Actinomycetota bacterium]
MRSVLALALGGTALVVLPGCDPNGDFVFGTYDAGGHTAVLDASSALDGTDPRGTLTIEGTLFGHVRCLHVQGSRAVVGLDLSPSIGLSAQAIVTDVEAPGTDAIRLSPTGLDAGDVCDAQLEPGPAQPGSFLVHDRTS